MFLCLGMTTTSAFTDIGCVALPWHFKFYILKCKNFKMWIFLINFLDELGNFKQKNFYTSKCSFFLHFKATDPFLISETTYQ